MLFISQKGYSQLEKQRIEDLENTNWKKAGVTTLISKQILKKRSIPGEKEAHIIKIKY